MLNVHIFNLTIYPKLDVYRKELGNNPKIGCPQSPDSHIPTLSLRGLISLWGEFSYISSKEWANLQSGSQCLYALPTVKPEQAMAA